VCTSGQSSHAYHTTSTPVEIAKPGEIAKPAE
jgi:hypothetical protein